MSTKFTRLKEPGLVLPVKVVDVAELPDIIFGGHWKPIWGDWEDENLTLKLNNYCPGPFNMEIKKFPEDKVYPEGIDLILSCSKCRVTSEFEPLKAARGKLKHLEIILSKCFFNAAIRPKDSSWDYFESYYVSGGK